MKWKLKSPAPGDMIRVKTGAVYHYGIFVSDLEIIQFGYPPEIGVIVPDSSVRVIATDIDGFLVGGFLEVAELSFIERRRRRSPDGTVEYARARLGEGGYNLLFNNCEHFANNCVFGKGRSEQTDKLSSLLSASTFSDVYIARIPEGARVGKSPIRARAKEIAHSRTEEERLEKYFSFELLRIAAKRSFGADITKLKLRRGECGRWECPELYVSVAHSGRFVSVAVSRSPIGVDIETVRELPAELASEVLTDSERENWESLCDDKKSEYLLFAFTAKEAYFKSLGEATFIPSLIDSRHIGVKGEYVTIGGESCLLTVYTEKLDSVRIFKDLEF